VNPLNDETVTSVDVRADPLIVNELGEVVVFIQTFPKAVNDVPDKVGEAATVVAYPVDVKDQAELPAALFARTLK
jgi:hypothetical protein